MVSHSVHGNSWSRYVTALARPLAELLLIGAIAPCSARLTGIRLKTLLRREV